TDYNKALSTKENAQNKLSSTKAEYEATVKECKEKEEIAKKIVDFITGAKRKVTALEQSVKDAESKLSKAEKELSYSERAYQIAQKEFEEAQKELEVLLKKKDEIVH
ncbi:MAG: hypothetical protein J6T70_17190, partial [Bacteroidales bacterium]|nr:hypothetical protein [Bacteroidales bacterium]